MVSINTLVKLKPIKVLVVGDLFLDQYITGKATRISPEAPVLVHQIDEESCFPGGAGNVAMNLAHLDAEVTLVARVGSDLFGDLIREQLIKEGINVELILTQKEYKTPRKIRILADGKQLLRIDDEKIVASLDEMRETILSTTEDLEWDIILLSDYGKGFLTDDLIQTMINLGERKNIKVIVDPKGLDYTKYRGAYLIKPNEKEAYLASKLDTTAQINEVARVLMDDLDIEKLVITRSSKGIALFSKGQKRTDFCIEKREVIDVTGAGDTVFAIIALSLANRVDLSEALELANFVACMTLDLVGCAALTMSDIAQKLFELKKYEKVISTKESLWFLKKLAAENPIKFIKIDEMNLEHLFKMIELLKLSPEVVYVIYVNSKVNKNWIDLLLSLNGIGFILTREKDLLYLLKELPSYSNLFTLQV